MNTKPFDVICLILVIIGAVNWGLIGFFNFNLVEAIFGFIGLRESSMLWLVWPACTVSASLGVFAFLQTATINEPIESPWVSMTKDFSYYDWRCPHTRNIKYF